MSIIRQQSLFDIHELYEMEPTHRFNAIFSTINLEPIWSLFEKKYKRRCSKGIKLWCHGLLVNRSCNGANCDN